MTKAGGRIDDEGENRMIMLAAALTARGSAAVGIKSPPGGRTLDVPRGGLHDAVPDSGR